MKTDKKEQKKKRRVYVIILLVILMIALWLTPRPTHPLQEYTPQFKERRSNLALIEKKYSFRTGKNVSLFEKNSVVQYIDTPNVAVKFLHYVDQTRNHMMDSLCPNWEFQSRYGLEFFTMKLSAQYQQDDYPIVFGEWDSTQRVPPPHLIAEVVIDEISITHKYQRPLVWTHRVLDQFDSTHTASVYLNRQVQEVLIGGTLRVYSAKDGTQYYRQPIKKVHSYALSRYERIGDLEIHNRVTPRQYMQSRRTPYIPREDSEVIERAIFLFGEEALHFLNKLTLFPIYDGKGKRGTIFDKRDGTIERKYHVNDTTKVTSEVSEVPNYSPKTQKL